MNGDAEKYREHQRRQRLIRLQWEMGVSSGVPDEDYGRIFNTDDLENYGWQSNMCMPSLHAVALLGKYVQDFMEPGLHRVVLFAHPCYHGEILLRHEQGRPEVYPFARNVPNVTIADWLGHLTPAAELRMAVESQMQRHCRHLQDLLWNVWEHHRLHQDEEPTTVQGLSRVHAWSSGHKSAIIKCPSALGARWHALTPEIQLRAWTEGGSILFVCGICGVESPPNWNCKLCYVPVCAACSMSPEEIAGRRLCCNCSKLVVEFLADYTVDERQILLKQIYTKIAGAYIQWPGSPGCSDLQTTVYKVSLLP